MSCLHTCSRGVCASCSSQLLNHSTPCTRRYTTTYSQIYTQLNGTWPAINYTSPVLHHTVLTKLTPATMCAPSECISVADQAILSAG